MSVFILKCKKCDHTFYDIVVLCTGEKIEDKCPKCGSMDLSISKMDKPDNKLWAEDEGCHHGDPKDFIKGKYKTDGESPCDTCTHKHIPTSEMTLDEEIDKKITLLNDTNTTLTLPQKLYNKFQRPWGQILKKVPLISKDNIIITIGDATTKEFLNKFYTPNLAIIDHRINRKRVTEKEKIDTRFFNPILKVKNPPSNITNKLYRSIENINFTNQNHTLIEVDGEEDLATLVCCLHAPIGSHVFYGQPNKGLVHIIVDKNIKYESEELYNQFE